METNKNTRSQSVGFRYIKYAVGEIILVVIGILIALQINNWNENRNKQKELLYIYQSIQSDLEIDLANIDSLLSKSDMKKLNFEAVLNNNITRTDYETKPDLQWILSGFPDMSLLDNGYKLLSNFSEIESITDKSFVKSINKFYSYYKTEIQVDQKSLALIFNNRDIYWTQEYDWYSDFLMKKPSSEFIEYALYNSEYKNQVANFYLVYHKIYIPHLLAYKKDAKRIIAQIEEKTQNQI